MKKVDSQKEKENRACPVIWVANGLVAYVFMLCVFHLWRVVVAYNTPQAHAKTIYLFCT
jgi:hypothetical protein